MYEGAIPEKKLECFFCRFNEGAGKFNSEYNFAKKKKEKEKKALIINTRFVIFETKTKVKFIR